MFLFSLVSAVAHITTEFVGDTGIDIEVTAPITIPVSTFINVTVHCFNKSDGMLLTSPEVTCRGILINPEGGIIANPNGVANGHYFEFYMLDTYATVPEVYSYTIHCNTSSIGGYQSAYFDVTPTGRTTPEGSIVVFFSLYAVVSFLLMLWSLYLILGALTSITTTWETIFLGMACYFNNMAVYYFLQQFLVLELSSDLALWGLTVFGFTHMFVPLVGLIFSWIKNGRAE